MQTTLIVARMKETDADAVAGIFADSDATDLPHIAGVSRRSLFQFNGLYFHLIQTADQQGPDLAAIREHPLFADISARLAAYVSAYDPQTWRGPRDAMAEPFYTWEAPQPAAAITKVALADVPANRRRGGEIKVVLGPQTTGAASGFLGVVTLEPGEYVAEHYHPYSDEFLYAVQGTLAITADDVPITLAPAEGVLVPKGARHRVANNGTERAQAVFHLCPLAPRPELGHVDTEPPPDQSR